MSLVGLHRRTVGDRLDDGEGREKHRVIRRPPDRGDHARLPNREPRRIAYVVSRFPKPSETFILREMLALEDAGWRVDLFAFIREKASVQQAGAERWMGAGDDPGSPARAALATAWWTWHAPVRLVTLYCLVIRELWRRPGQLARGFAALGRAPLWARRIRQEGISHVHAHFALHPTVAALAMSQLAGVTFSFTGHSHDIYRHPEMLRVKVQRARSVVVISRLLRDSYVAPCLPEAERAKIRVVRCGLDISRYPFRPPAAQPAAQSIVTVARLVECKGLRHLIEACALLLEAGHDVHCRIVGDGPLRDPIERQIAALGLDGRVELRGSLDHEAVKRSLAEAAVFVLPSIVTADGTQEGVPVSIMEAMAMGVPVVATRTGAIAEIAVPGKTGILVPPGDPSQLAGAIERVWAGGGEIGRMTLAARRHVEESFDARASVAQLHQLFCESTGAGDERERAGRRGSFARVSSLTSLLDQENRTLLP